MIIRHLVWASLLLLPSVALAQSPDAWRERFAAGQQALAGGALRTYAEEMRAAAEAMPPGHLNRPFVQYHAARAAALSGRPAEAVAWLRRAWDEDIEALMISFADHDPAFDAMRSDSGFTGLMASLADVALVTRPLGGSVRLVTGAGSNVLVQTGPDGAVLVDTGYAPALPALSRVLDSLRAGQVGHLLITHPHEDHLGGAPGLGARATIIAHPRTAVAMGEPYVFMEGVQVPPKPPEARPDLTIGRDTVLALNGEDVLVVALEAHTDADLAVYFTGSRVAHLGDLYLAANPMMFPGREDPDGFLDDLEAFLDALHPEAVVVGGHDAPVDIAAVRAQVATTRACMAFVREAVAEGRSAEEAVDAAGQRFAPQWIRFFYGVLGAGDAGI
jgi:glyoxylase-like metal-dependent hydrolase (beta-lactamase superfamily II)